MQWKAEVRIEQTLHGYDRGHRELASSAVLDDQARSVMLVLSDLLATSAFSSGKSYLTAYPLQSASRYVLARTWPAGQGYRPGSVWTHSLLLDYQTLVVLPDLLFLQSLFQPPRLEKFDEYRRPVILSAEGGKTTHINISKSQAQSALLQLYGDCPADDVIVRSTRSSSDEILALALWRQMWPALRREFAFTTAEGGGLSGFNFACTMRFSMHTLESTDVAQISEPEGYSALLDDLPIAGPTDLRAFLGRYAIESPVPRRSAAQVASFFLKAREAAPVERLAAARPLIVDGKMPRLARDLIAAAVVATIEFDDVMKLVSMAGSAPVDVDSGPLAKRLTSLSSQQMRALLDSCLSAESDGFALDLFKQVVTHSPSAVVAGAASDINRIAMAQLRPDVLETPEWWPVDDAARGALISRVAEFRDVDWAAVLSALRPTIGPNTVGALLEALSANGESIGVALFKQGNAKIREKIAIWIVARPSRLQLLAENVDAITPDMLEVLAAAQIGQPPPFDHIQIWSALFTILEKAPPAGTSSLIIGYLLSLRLEDPASRKLAGITFAPLYRAVKSYRLSSRETRYLETSLARLSATSYGMRSVIDSALTRWPVSSSDCGALQLSNDGEQILELAREVAKRGGSDALKAALQISDLSVTAKACIHRALEDHDKKKSGGWPFSWW
ncbi:GAP1-N1 domain-containing protein [Paraburkholderia adhaesiva]|uniref:GAP1-N1 domain-containing protein n=1 Tax=Paraburkholderia adhaesiva TaxID=2883244 RepID=UPI001F2B3E06|nr:hypothetical protein [Paraburkholderia adhaesiva]